jgi:hypothetical protein
MLCRWKQPPPGAPQAKNQRDGAGNNAEELQAEKKEEVVEGTQTPPPLRSALEENCFLLSTDLH